MRRGAASHEAARHERNESRSTPQGSTPSVSAMSRAPPPCITLHTTCPCSYCAQCSHRGVSAAWHGGRPSSPASDSTHLTRGVTRDLRRVRPCRVLCSACAEERGGTCRAIASGRAREHGKRPRPAHLQHQAPLIHRTWHINQVAIADGVGDSTPHVRFLKMNGRLSHSTNPVRLPAVRTAPAR